MGKSLRFDFQAAVRQVMMDHPALEKNTVFVNAADDQWYGSEEVFELLSYDEDVADTLNQSSAAARQYRTSFAQAIEVDNGKVLRAVFFYSKDRDYICDPASQYVNDHDTFQHEVSHVLDKNREGALGENTADAYALLRRLQRTGGHSENIDYASWRRAFNFMQRDDKLHMATFTLDRIVIDSQTADFLSLSPAETAAIAKQYARRHTPDKKQLKKLSDDFKGLRNKPPTADTFKQVAAIALRAPANSPTFYIAARILSAPLQKKGIVLQGQRITLQGPQWQKMRGQLAKKLEKLPAAHPLRKL